MAQLWSTGPVDVFVAAGPGFTPIFLGHGKTAPQINLIRRYENRMSDLGGSQIPHARTYQGQYAIVAMTLERWDWTTLTIIEDIARTGTAPGVDAAGTIGQIMETTPALYLILYLRFEYLSGNVVPGYRFVRAYPENEEAIQPGTTDNTIGLHFYCGRALGTLSGTGIPVQVYDYSVAGLPAMT
jgi:hypothetical protein